MDTMKTILARRSYRGKYMVVPVPRDHLKMILEAGLAAPSGCNKQTTSLIAVDDPALLAQLHGVITPSFGVPQDMELVCFLPVGKADEEIRTVEKKPFERRAWFNGFGREEV